MQERSASRNSLQKGQASTVTMDMPTAAAKESRYTKAVPENTPSHCGSLTSKKRLCSATVTPDTASAPMMPVSSVLTPAIETMPAGTSEPRKTVTMAPTR
jgi:hypothetical protein